LEQILGYANDINILERSLRYIREIFEELAIAGEVVGWRINELKSNDSVKRRKKSDRDPKLGA
jgi:hypothetical protein